MEGNLFMYNIKSKHLFIKNGVLFILLIILSDFIIGNILKYLYFKQESGICYETTYSIYNTHEDVLIFGASTASRHYDPKVFEKELKMSCYNTGRDGQGLFYFLAIQEAILKRYSPKIIVLELYFNALNKDKNDYDRLNALLPYYNSSDEIKKIIDLRNNYDNIKTYSSLYPFNSMIATILSNLQNNGKSQNGFSPLTTNVIKLEREQILKRDYEIDNLKIWALEKFITNCKNNNIKLYIARSPYYSKDFVKTKSLKKIEEIITKQEIKLIDYSNPDTLLFGSNIKIKEVMSNASHLNIKGAQIYSKMICDEIINKKTSKEK